MLKNNLEEFKILNIVEWHKQGYLGKGINIAELENVNPNLSFFDGKVKTPFDKFDNLNTHGQFVIDVMHQVAPMSTIYAMPSTITSSGGGSLFGKILPFALANNINIIGASLGGIENNLINQKIRNYKDKGLIFVTSAGNRGDRGLTSYAKSNEWISVGALHLFKGESLKLAHYSSRGEELDLVSFSNLDVHNAKNNKTMFKEGTSFSSPVVVGMLALVQEFFKKNAGRLLNQQEIEKFIKEHTKDLGIKGHDQEYGYGLFILPKPKDIDINKYLKESGEDMQITDIKGHWAEKQIKEAMELGLLKGYPDNTFKPDKSVTRAELSKVVVDLYKKLRG